VVENAEGRVVAVGAAIDPKTRSLSVRVEAPPRPDFIPGRATRVRIFAAGQAAGLTVPRSAVTTIGGKSVVFVRTPAGFDSVPVQVVGSTGDRTVVAGALKSGAAVAVSGVSELKAQAGG
jgi:cobalt-zinc-cadmium efflux system membrane fusion protein